MLIIPPSNLRNPATLIPVIFALGINHVASEGVIICENPDCPKTYQQEFDVRAFFDSLPVSEYKPVILPSNLISPNSLLDSQKLRTTREDVYSCTCGKTEIYAPAFLSPRHKVFQYIQNGTCSLCKNPLSLHADVPALYFTRQTPTDITWHPPSAQNEAKKILSKLSDGFRISKTRDTGIPFEFNGVQFFLDPGLVTLLAIAKRAGAQTNSTFISGRRSLGAFARATLLSNTSFRVILLPYFDNYHSLVADILNAGLTQLQFFLLLVISISWKRNIAHINTGDISDILYVNDEKIARILSKVLDGNDFFGSLPALNRSILSQV